MCLAGLQLLHDAPPPAAMKLWPLQDVARSVSLAVADVFTLLKTLGMTATTLYVLCIVLLLSAFENLSTCA